MDTTIGVTQKSGGKLFLQLLGFGILSALVIAIIWHLTN
jgi:hypothetical protein